MDCRVASLLAMTDLRGDLALDVKTIHHSPSHCERSAAIHRETSPSHAGLNVFRSRTPANPIPVSQNYIMVIS